MGDQLLGRAAIGPLLGGVLLESFWWGSVFLLAVPVMVLLLVGPVLLPEYKDPGAGRRDLRSAAMSLFASRTFSASLVTPTISLFVTFGTFLFVAQPPSWTRPARRSPRGS